MGWDFGPYENKAALVEYLTQSWQDNEGFYTCLAKASKTGILWTVWEEVSKETGKSRRWIGCDLIKGGKGRYGYKGMCETMGPLYYSCPLEFLDMVPEPTGDKARYCQGWRDKVRAWQLGWDPKELA